MTNNINLQQIQYKVIHRAHVTQHKMGPVDSDICSHCTLNTPDSYFHATWWSLLTFGTQSLKHCPFAWVAACHHLPPSADLETYTCNNFNNPEHQAYTYCPNCRKEKYPIKLENKKDCKYYAMVEPQKRKKENISTWKFHWNVDTHHKLPKCTR